MGDILVFAKRNLSAVVIKDSTGTPKTLVANTNYKLNAKAGHIELLDITTGGPYVQPFKIDYTPGASTEVGLFTAGSMEYFFRFEGLNTADANEPGDRRPLQGAVRPGKDSRHDHRRLRASSRWTAPASWTSARSSSARPGPVRRRLQPEVASMPDTTLSALFPGRADHGSAGKRLRLRPVILAELPAVERVVEAWRLLVATGGDFLHSEGWEDFLELVAAAAGHPRAWLDQLSEEDFERLICLVLAANEEVWKPEIGKEPGEAFTWAQITQRLVEHGHAWDTLQGYTLTQARAFLGECFRLESETLAREIQAAAFSMADEKAVTKAVKELRRVK